LLDKWRRAGGSYVDGLDLLIHQAISQIQIFADQKVDRLSMAHLLRIEGLKALH
jgi:shikimate 5-dehydrogenase